jgi:hypothetical protein
MKVLYQNKVGQLVPLTRLDCSNCIYYPKNTSIGWCRKVGLMNLCVGVLNPFEFTPSSSEILEL